MSFENPYIAGSSVGGTSAFIGRDDILRDVRQVLRHPKENAIVLYGQRRIGKTSVLQELEAKLPQKDAYHPVLFDLLGKVHHSLENVLRDLADTISEALEKGKVHLGSDPKTEFRKIWLPNLLNHLETKSLVLLFDEFDALDDPTYKKTSQDFFHYLRDLLFHVNPREGLNPERISFVFVIGRNIDDMDNIASALFKNIKTKRVSLLNHDDTVKLIRFSVNNKSLQWSNEAIEGVWQLTNGHPFLTQCLCSHVWENLYGDEPNVPPIVTLKNIEAAIPKTLESSKSALEWLWGGLPPAERIVISALADTGAEVISESHLELLLKKSGVQVVIKELQDAPRLLKDWDLIEPVEDGYRFRVELLRRWIEKNKPLSQVQKELENIIPVANNLYKAGEGFYNSSQLDAALSSLREAIRVNPNHVSANQLLAEILLTQKKADEARKILEKLYKYQPSAAHERLIQTLLILAQSSDDEDEQISLYKRVLEIDAEHPEAKSQLSNAWERQGDKASKKGDLGTALTAYRNAGIDDKGAEVEEKVRQQTQLYRQMQDDLKKCHSEQKHLKWKLFPLTLIFMLFIMGGFFWKYQPLQIQLETQKVEIKHLSEQSKQLTGKREEQEKEIKSLQKQLKTTIEWYEFILSLHIGIYRVMVGFYDRQQIAEKESEEITAQHPELKLLEVIPLPLGEKWGVNIGKSYSQEDAERLVTRIRKLYQKDAYIINPDCKTRFECLLKSLKKGNFRIIIGTYSNDKKRYAQEDIDLLRKKHPKLTVRKYKERTKGNWRVYIGCYTNNSAKRLRRWAINAKIAQEDSYIISCSR
jgi:tetratricopeptide (TPR) repeat protein